LHARRDADAIKGYLTGLDPDALDDDDNRRLAEILPLPPISNMPATSLKKG
jgi:hypothetical protein